MSSSGSVDGVANGVTNGVSSSIDKVIDDIKPTLYDWTFNVFELAERTGGRPLYAVTMALLEDQGLLDGWKLDRDTMSVYLTAVETSYRTSNPYHNNTHAADVTQTAAVIMTSMEEVLPSGLTQLERFALIISSAVHDLAHPGVNNDFLVRSRAPVAITYNDRSPNENMHASKAFEKAFIGSRGNIFAAFSEEEYAQLRKMIVAIVLSTDMAVHFELLDSFKAAQAAAPDIPSWDTQPQRSLLLQMAVHLADLANPSRPFPLALRWAERVVTEFLAQGDRETALGLKVSPMCDRALVCMPKAQLGFVQLFMQPTLDLFRPAAPSFFDMALPWLQDTKQRWLQLQAAGVMFPDPDSRYPDCHGELGPAGLTAGAARLHARDAARHAASGASTQQQGQQQAAPEAGGQQ